MYAIERRIGSGESLEQTAVRELREETGIEARIGRRRDRGASGRAGKSQRIAYYLMEMTGASVPTEARLTRWLTPQDAVRRATFKETCAVIEKAGALLGERANP